MPIFDETGQSGTITEGERALELFTDRYEAVRLFLSYINDDPPHNSILFFHGEGGNGKSLLLKYLRRNFCKRLRPTNWKYVQKKYRNNKKLIEVVAVAEDTAEVPSAMLDFGMKTVGNDRPRDPFSGLLMLKRQLVGYGFHFPLFDFTCVLYLERTKQLTPELLRNIFPPEETEFITDIADLIHSSKAWAVGKTVLTIFNKHNRKWRGWLARYVRQRKLDEKQVERIAGMDLQAVPVDELPQLFAEDLNVAVAIERTERLALFFDTHDSFWGDQRTRELSKEYFHHRDEWLRKLIGALDFRAGIVVVVAGREPPKWGEPNKSKIPPAYIFHKQVGLLSVGDARHFLECAGIEDPVLREALTVQARVQRGEVHPYLLGLCADIALAARLRGEELTPEEFKSKPEVADKADELVNRLLSYVDHHTEYAVRALAACRSFDREIYFLLGAKLNFKADEPTFRMLTGFSFVWNEEQAEADVYRVHELLRRLLHDRGDEVTRKADEVLAAHYSERGDSAAMAESVYHRNRLNWRRGVNDALFLFDVGWQMNSLDLCRAIIGVRPELLVEGEYERGMFSHKEGKLLMKMSRYKEAESKLWEATDLFMSSLKREPIYNVAEQLGDTYTVLGQLFSARANFPEALKAYNLAVGVSDHLIKSAPDEIGAYEVKVRALCVTADLQRRLAQYDEAQIKYVEGISLLEFALSKTPHDFTKQFNSGDAINLQNNIATSRKHLGELYFLRSQYEDALGNYQKSVKAVNEVMRHLKIAFDYYDTKGDTYVEIGKVYERLGVPELALKAYSRALRIYRRLLGFNPENYDGLQGVGTTLNHLGDVYHRVGKRDEELRCCKEALEAFDKALTIVPNSIGGRYRRAQALSQLAGAQSNRPSQVGEAIKTYEAASSAFEELTLEAPNLAEAYDGQASALMLMGQLEAWRRNVKEAIEITRKAVAVYDKALAIVPDFIHCHNNKGRTLKSLGMWLNADGQNVEALDCWREAETAFSRSLALAPNDQRIVFEREEVRSLQQLTPEQQDLLTSMSDMVFDIGDIVKKKMAGEEE